LGGFFFIIIGLVAFSVNFFFAPVALIIILMGAVFMALGLMGRPIMSQQVVFQTDQPASYGSKDSVKWCRSCRDELLASANECCRCGLAQ
jgi:hypothetical protein